MKRKLKCVRDGWKQLKINDFFNKSVKGSSSLLKNQDDFEFLIKPKMRPIKPLPSLSSDNDSEKMEISYDKTLVPLVELGTGDVGDSDNESEIMNISTVEDVDPENSFVFHVEETTLPIPLPVMSNSEEGFYSSNQIIVTKKRKRQPSETSIDDELETTTITINKSEWQSVSPTNPVQDLIENTVTLSLEDIDNDEDITNEMEDIEKIPIVLKCIQKITKWVKEHALFKEMLERDQLTILKHFLNLPVNFILFCLKLFLWKSKWYDIHKTVSTMKLVMKKSEIDIMYECLVTRGFLEKNLFDQSIADLLHLLSNNDLKVLCKSFKIKLTNSKKEIMIKKLINHSNHQATLSSAKTTDSILRERIKEKMGKSVKLNGSFRNLLKTVNLAYSFTSEDFLTFSDLHFFINQIDTKMIILPKYQVDVTTKIFSTKAQFWKFIQALDIKHQLNLAIDKNQHDKVLEISRLSLEKFKDELENTEVEEIQFKRFTAGHKYASVLTKASEVLTSNHFTEVFPWLELLLSQNHYYQHKRGFWYRQMALIQYHYMKRHTYAAEIVIKGLKDDSISIVDQYELTKRGNLIKNAKTNKVSEELCEEISNYQRQNFQVFPTIVIEAVAMSENRAGSKRKYKQVIDGEECFFDVEGIAINHYNQKGFDKVVHCEGSILKTLFFLLFWDIIYDESIPGVFLIEIQTFPLDLYSGDFFPKRQEAILERIESIDTKWSDRQLLEFISTIWGSNYNKKACISDIIPDLMQLCTIIYCIGRSKIAKIMERFCKNYGLYSAGLPDLFMWNMMEKKCKFVEVKGEKDKLSTKQELWLSYLLELELDAEVCHVHTIGSKGSAKHKHKTSM